MRTEVVKLTPALAEHYLSKNLLNRNVSDRLVNKYAQEMEQKEWMLNHQGIAFYDDNTVADGQHRLLAIIKSGATVPMLVTFGLKKPAAMTIDNGRKRSMVDGIKIGGYSEWIMPRHISMINVIADPKRLTPHETVAWLEGMEDSAKFAVDIFACNKKALVSSTLHAAMALAHFYNPDREADLMHFASVYMDGIATDKKEISAIKLRDEFLTNTNANHSFKRDKFFKAQRALQAFLNKEPISRLVRPKDYIWIYNMEEN
jgi:hypothetical protein